MAHRGPYFAPSEPGGGPCMSDLGDQPCRSRGRGRRSAGTPTCTRSRRWRHLRPGQGATVLIRGQGGRRDPLRRRTPWRRAPRPDRLAAHLRVRRAPSLPGDTWRRPGNRPRHSRARRPRAGSLGGRAAWPWSKPWWGVVAPGRRRRAGEPSPSPLGAARPPPGQQPEIWPTVGHVSGAAGVHSAVCEARDTRARPPGWRGSENVAGAGWWGASPPVTSRRHPTNPEEDGDDQGPRGASEITDHLSRSVGEVERPG